MRNMQVVLKGLVDRQYNTKHLLVPAPQIHTICKYLFKYVNKDQYVNEKEKKKKKSTVTLQLFKFELHSVAGFKLGRHDMMKICDIRC